jgi:AcrR family transcriptional regulator
MTRKPASRGAKKGAAAQGSARQRIFDTASELFYRDGIRAVGVETIAAEANTTKMTLYRNFPSKDILVAAWLSAHDASFWQGWDTMLQRYPDDPRRQLGAAFELLARHISDPRARGCPMANAAVEITRRSHPARFAARASGRPAVHPDGGRAGERDPRRAQPGEQRRARGGRAHQGAARPGAAARAQALESAA